MLDQALGAFDVETKVGRIDVKALNQAPEDKSLSNSLTKALDALFPSSEK